MKFKVAVIGLLTAILTVCCFTSHRLIQIEEERTILLLEETKRATGYSRIAAYLAIENQNETYTLKDMIDMDVKYYSYREPDYNYYEEGGKPIIEKEIERSVNENIYKMAEKAFRELNNGWYSPEEKEPLLEPYSDK